MVVVNTPLSERAVSLNTALTERAVSTTASNVMGAWTENAPSPQSEGSKLRPRMLRKQSNVTLRGAQTPNKLVKKNVRRESNSNAQSPSPGTGFVQVMGKQFGSVGGRVAGMENWTPVKVGGVGGDVDIMVGGRGAETNGQVMGSRRMVDLFLSSRRKRVAGSEDSNVFL